MSFVSGDFLGSFEILAPATAGGMGQVYRAHDTRLGRDVAIKILPDDSDQRSRVLQYGRGAEQRLDEQVR